MLSLEMTPRLRSHWTRTVLLGTGFAALLGGNARASSPEIDATTSRIARHLPSKLQASNIAGSIGQTATYKAYDCHIVIRTATYLHLFSGTAPEVMHYRYALMLHPVPGRKVNATTTFVPPSHLPKQYSQGQISTIDLDLAHLDAKRVNVKKTQSTTATNAFVQYPYDLTSVTLPFQMNQSELVRRMVDEFSRAITLCQGHSS